MMNSKTLRAHHFDEDMLELRWRLVEPLLSRMMTKAETVGICVLGSSSRTGERPFVDSSSDFDIALFLDLKIPNNLLNLTSSDFQKAIQPYLPEWLPNFKFRVPRTVLDTDPPFEINVHQLVINYEEMPNVRWLPDRREAFNHTCDVIYDPQHRIKQLIECKTSFNHGERAIRLAENVSRIPVILQHAVDKSISRELWLDAHLALNDCIEKLIAMTFDLNERDESNIKWRAHIGHQLLILPTHWSKRMEQAVLVKSLSSQDLERRKKIVKEIFNDLLVLLKQHSLLPEDAYSFVVTAIYPGWQLARTTAADRVVGPKLDQYQKMELEVWNEINFYLEVASK